MDNDPISVKIKKFFTKHPHELKYDAERLCFSWMCECADRATIPKMPGVYALFSHSGERIQKVGKADGNGGLFARINRYTGKKNMIKLNKDPTVALWYNTMTNELIEQSLTLYYMVTPPRIIKNEISDYFSFDGFSLQWARDFEFKLSRALNLECGSGNLVDTHMLLSGTD